MTEKAIKKNVGQMPESSKYLREKFGIGQRSFIGPGSEKKWSSAENSPQGIGDHIADKMLLEFAESGHPIFRATTPLSRAILKSKGHERLSIHFTADNPTIETFFASNFLSISSVSTEQWRFSVNNWKIIKMDRGKLRINCSR